MNKTRPTENTEKYTQSNFVMPVLCTESFQTQTRQKCEKTTVFQVVFTSESSAGRESMLVGNIPFFFISLTRTLKNEHIGEYTWIEQDVTYEIS